MRPKLLMATLLTGASFAAVTPAQAAEQVYLIQGTADGPGSCQPLAGVPGYHRCDTLRAGISAANADPDGPEEGGDVVYLQAAGTYVVNEALPLQDDTSVFGRGPRTTTVRSAGSSRVFTVAAGESGFVFRLGIAGGRAGTGAGGNILNEGTLILANSRVSEGAAGTGGGIANVGGELSVTNSLIDGNLASGGTGGGILSRSTTESASLQLINSTVALNQALDPEVNNGAGVAIPSGAAGHTALLIGVTIARNAILSTFGTAGLYAAANQTVSAYGSLLGLNVNSAGAVSNCGGDGTVTDTGQAPSNIEDGSSCGFDTATGNLGLSAGLVDAGGDTEVITIASTGPAKDAVLGPCITGSDQRGAPRSTGNCDAGAFEEGAVAPAIASDPFPEPQSPPPVPTPTATVADVQPTPTPSPTPVVNQTAVVGEQRGTVKVQLPGTKTFVDLDATRGIPMGSTIDTRKGAVAITTVPKAGAPPETATFKDGLFKLTQSKGITNLTLVEPLDCSKKGRRASAAQKKAKKRKLWGDGKGAFRTTGRYSAATVRGTRWLVEDTCTTTTTTVRVGSVTVTHGKKRIVVRAGKRYVARAKK